MQLPVNVTGKVASLVVSAGEAESHGFKNSSTQGSTSAGKSFDEETLGMGYSGARLWMGTLGGIVLLVYLFHRMGYLTLFGQRLQAIRLCLFPPERRCCLALRRRLSALRLLSCGLVNLSGFCTWLSSLVSRKVRDVQSGTGKKKRKPSTPGAAVEDAVVLKPLLTKPIPKPRDKNKNKEREKQEDIQEAIELAELTIDRIPKLRGFKMAPLLTPAMARQIFPFLPYSTRIQDLSLVYSSSEHGYSLRKFYARAGKEAGERECMKGLFPTLLIFKDSNNHVFGCFCDQLWKVAADNNYFGDGQTMVFKIRPTFHVYRWSGLNSYFMLATKDYMAVGGGTDYAIRLDSAFREGTSGTCETFASPCLASQSQFRCDVVEAWAFVEPSF